MLAQTQREGLGVQVALQRLLRACQLSGVQRIVAIQIVALGASLTAPLAVVRRQRCAAVTLPALAIVVQGRGRGFIFSCRLCLCWVVRS